LLQLDIVAWMREPPQLQWPDTPDRDPARRSARSVIDANSHDTAAAKLAVDGKLEEREILPFTLEPQFRSN
jgi:hypothetical protein